MAGKPLDFQTETVNIEDLKRHPRNYRRHPDDQLEHIIASIKEHGFYRNIVIARDNTILAGHGVVQASKKMGLSTVPVIRLDVDPESSQALKLLTGDNEISHLVENDDRLLSELLKEIKDFDIAGLLGTGYDEMMLANLVMVTRPASEIEDFNEAAEWVGMPEYDEGDGLIQLKLNFKSEEDRKRCANLLGLPISDGAKGRGASFWWPHSQKKDLSSIRFESKANV